MIRGKPKPAKQEEGQTPICTTKFMHETLKYLAPEKVGEWLERMKALDAVITPLVKTHLEEITANGSKVSVELAEVFKKAVQDAGFLNQVRWIESSNVGVK